MAWKHNFFKYFQQKGAGNSRLTQALLRQIEQHRNGETVDSGLMKKVIDSYGQLPEFRSVWKLTLQYRLD